MCRGGPCSQHYFRISVEEAHTTRQVDNHRTHQVQLEHDGARVRLGEGDVDALLEAPPDGRVQLPGDVGRPEHQDLLGGVGLLF